MLTVEDNHVDVEDEDNNDNDENNSEHNNKEEDEELCCSLKFQTLFYQDKQFIH